MSARPDWKALRALFPAVERSTYLNTAGGGPLSREAWESARSYLDAAYHLGDIEWDEWLSRVETTRERLARLIGVAPREIAFLGNASQAMNAACEAVSETPGRVVLVADDFPSITLPWLARGRDVLWLEGRADLQAVADALDPGVGIVAVGHVHYVTGYRFPLEELSRTCRERGARLIVDATQSFGAVPVDASRADVLFFSGYKWAASGYGIAPLYVRKEVLDSSPATNVGWRSAREPYAMKSRELDRSPEARALELGHPPFAGVLALAGSLSILERVGLEAVESRIHELADRLLEGLDRLGVEVLSPRPRLERAGITLVRVPAPATAARELAARGVFVSARGPGLRVSLHYYNDESDVERFLDALARQL